MKKQELEIYTHQKRLEEARRALEMAKIEESKLVQRKRSVDEQVWTGLDDRGQVFTTTVDHDRRYMHAHDDLAIHCSRMPDSGCRERGQQLCLLFPAWPKAESWPHLLNLPPFPARRRLMGTFLFRGSWRGSQSHRVIFRAI